MAQAATVGHRASAFDDAMEHVRRLSTTPVRAVFLARMLNAVAWLAETLDESALGDAAAQRSDYSALLRALEEPEIVQSLLIDDPLAKARLSGLTSKQFLLHAEGGAIAVEDVAKRLGMTRQGVDRRRRAGRLIGVTMGRRGYAYPVWQFGDVGTLQGLESVLAALDGVSPWAQTSWFVSANSRLGDESPLLRLRKGEIDAVIAAARAYGGQGGS